MNRGKNKSEISSQNKRGYGEGNTELNRSLPDLVPFPKESKARMAPENPDEKIKQLL